MRQGRERAVGESQANFGALPIGLPTCQCSHDGSRGLICADNIPSRQRMVDGTIRRACTRQHWVPGGAVDGVIHRRTAIEIALNGA
ncbi:hypothetical protein D3C85_1330980 [compost metagenome]